MYPGRAAKPRPHVRGAAGALVAGGVGVLGLAGALGFAAVSAHNRDWSGLSAAALPVAFLVAGLLGTRARPDHVGLLLLESVGALHLVAFSLLGFVAARSRPSGWGLWVVTVVGDAAYLGGFLALAVVVACYPHGTQRTRVQVWFVRLAMLVTALALLEEAVGRSSLTLSAGSGATALPAPSPLPLVALPFELFVAVPALVLFAVAVLVGAARGFDEAEQRALSWGRIAAIVLGTLLAITPAADSVLSDAQWSAVFLSLASTVPFLLLAGLVRYRLLQVDAYLVRTVARGFVAALVVVAVAAASAVFDRRGIAAAGLALTVAAALGGGPLARRLERVADRLVTGGRVGRGQVAERLAGTLAAAGHDTMLDRACSVLAEALDVSWVRIVGPGPLTGSHGDQSGPAQAFVELSAAGQTIGTLECGRRRGGWRGTDLAVLRGCAGQIALMTREIDLTRQLATRVEELSASRGRLVQAEDTARRHIERDLHDGVQQQLVALLASLTVARSTTAGDSPAAAALHTAHDLAQQALRDLRELVSGIHPPLLGDRGLVAAVVGRATNLPLNVDIDADPRIADVRFAPEIEGAAYFVVLEALANVMKHSGAQHARVLLAPLDGAGLRVAIVDDGNGATDGDGSGLTGLRDRVEALGGRFTVHADSGIGTTVIAEFEIALPVGIDA